MILGDQHRASLADKSSRVLLDDLFRRAAARHPNALALLDPPNRSDFTDGAPRALTYAQADRVISAIAGRLRALGLQTDAIVAYQLPNTVESVLTLLGILRAGLIAAPMPLLWRGADAIPVLRRIDAKMLITCGHVGAVDFANLAMRCAAEIFPIRHVGCFGRHLPDGVVPFDELLVIKTPEPVPSFERERMPNAAAHVAVITWDASGDGLVPVARNHSELLSGGLAVALETKFDRDAVILSTAPATSFAGLCLTVMPWLLAGGTLCLHQPFEPSVLIEQLRVRKCQAVVLPGALVTPLAAANCLHPRNGLRSILALWRTPDRLALSPRWRQPTPALIDVAVFGEAALFAARRGDDGRPVALAFGRLVAPRGASDGVLVAELSRSNAGTLAVRGPMMPKAAFPPGAERGSLPYFKLASDGSVDTGFPCRRGDDGSVMVTGSSPGMVNVGGYRFAMSELQDLVRRAGGEVELTALPDAILGQRLAGTAQAPEVVRKALAEIGVNPLLADAFRERHNSRADAA